MIAAIVPAAGLSVRMGTPKLTLDIGGESLIRRVVRAMICGGVDRVVVVAPPPGQDGAEAVARLAVEAGADVVRLEAPTADMRATIERGLEALAESDPPDAVLIAPGDSVGLVPGLVASVIGRFRENPGRIVVPTRAGKGGHPIGLPWAEARRIPDLPEGLGVNALIASRPDLIDRIEVPFVGHDADLDTPEDYRRWRLG